MCSRSRSSRSSARASPSSTPDITYSFYPVWCDLFRIPYETVPLDESFCVNLRDYDKPNGGVILPNPNAPTGRVRHARGDRGSACSTTPDCVVIIDEAYVDFGAQSAIPLLDKVRKPAGRADHEQIPFARGHALSATRFGSETLISTLEAVKNSYNSYTMDSLALAVGEASIRDEAYFRETCRKVAATRDRAADELRALGFEVTPSLANFLFATHPKKAAPEIFAALREKGIFIRYFKLPRIDNHLRITVGTDEQMDALIAALKQIL
ncbi:MAG: pyridoxal phosphate-dependent aminotransferase [Butyricicoccaceae bacterium]